MSVFSSPSERKRKGGRKARRAITDVVSVATEVATLDPTVLPQEKEEDENHDSVFANFFDLDGPTSKISKWSKKIVEKWWFSTFVLIAILVNCFFIAGDSEIEEKWFTDASTVLEPVFLGIFTIEAILKVLAYGFALNKDSYLRDGWNVLDFLLVIVGWISFIIAAGGIGNDDDVNLTPIRVVRVLRALRSVNKIEGMKLLINAMLVSLRGLSEMIMLILFSFLVFGLISTQLWGGGYHSRCFRSIPEGIMTENPFQNQLLNQLELAVSPVSFYGSGYDSTTSSSPTNSSFNSSTAPAPAPSFLPDHLHNNSAVFWSELLRNNFTQFAEFYPPVQGGILLPLQNIYFNAEQETFFHSGTFNVPMPPSDSNSSEWVNEWLSRPAIARHFRPDCNGTSPLYFASDSASSSPPSNGSCSLIYDAADSFESLLEARNQLYYLGVNSGFRVNNITGKLLVNVTESRVDEIGDFIVLPATPLLDVNRDALNCEFRARIDDGDLPLNAMRLFGLQYSPESVIDVCTTENTDFDGSLLSNDGSVDDGGVKASESDVPVILYMTREELERDQLCGYTSWARQCSDPRELCLPIAPNPYYDFMQFDHIWWALLNLFAAMTGDAWSQMRYFGQESRSSLSWIFWVVFEVAMLFLGMNIVLAIVINTFSEAKRDMKHARKRKRGHSASPLGIAGTSQSMVDRALSLADKTEQPQNPIKAWFLRQWNRLWDEVIKETPLPDSRWREITRHIHEHFLFETSIVILILLNTGILAAEHVDQHPDFTAFSEISNIVFTIIFLLEMLFKLAGLGVRNYLHDRMNAFDAVVVVASVVELVINVTAYSGLSGGQNSSISIIFRALRCLRIFKLARRWTALQSVIKQIARSINSIFYLTLIMLLFTFIYAVAGRQFFQYKMTLGDLPELPLAPLGQYATQAPRWKFDTLAESMITTFQVLTADEWTLVFYSMVRVNAGFALVWAISWISLGNFVLLNLFVAILLEGVHAEKNRRIAIARHRLQAQQRKRQEEQAAMEMALLAQKAKKGGLLNVARYATLVRRYPTLSSQFPIPGVDTNGKVAEVSDHEKDSPAVSSSSAGATQHEQFAALPRPGMTRLSRSNTGIYDNAMAMSTDQDARSLNVNRIHTASRKSSINLDESPLAVAAAPSEDLSPSKSKRKKKGGGKGGGKQPSKASPATTTTTSIVTTPPAGEGLDKDANADSTNKKSLDKSQFGLNLSLSHVHLERLSRDDSDEGSDEDSAHDKMDGKKKTNSAIETNLSLKSPLRRTTSSRRSRPLSPRDALLAHGAPSSVLDVVKPRLTSRLSSRRDLKKDEEDSSSSDDEYSLSESISASEYEDEEEEDCCRCCIPLFECWDWFFERPPLEAIEVLDATIEDPTNLSGHSSRKNSGASVAGSMRASQRDSGTVHSSSRSTGGKKDENDDTPIGSSVRAGSRGSTIRRRSTLVRLANNNKAKTEEESEKIVDHGVTFTAVQKMHPKKGPKMQVKRSGDLASLRKEKLEGRSLGLFATDNAFRLFCQRVTAAQWFEWLMLFVIVASCTTIAIDHPKLDESWKSVLRIFDAVFLALFIIEAGLKVVAFGFIRNKTAYLRDGWDRLDFFVVIIGIITTSYSVANPLFEAAFLRAVRAIRPLRLLGRFASTRLVVSALVTSAKYSLNVFLVTSVFWIIFGVLGVQLFGGQFGECSDTSILKKADCSGYFYPDWQLEQLNAWPYAAYTPPEVVIAPREWVPSQWNFDNIGGAFLALFQVCLNSNWMDILYRAVDATGVRDEGPVLNANLSNSIYFILWVVIGNFFALNVFLAAIIGAYDDMRQRYDGSLFLTAEQQEWQNLQRIVISSRPKPRPHPPANTILRFFFYITSSKIFQWFITFCIFANVLFIALEYYHQPPWLKDTIDLANLIFLIIFTAEALIKILGLGPVTYYHDHWNKFDFILVVAGWATSFIDVTGVSGLRVTRLLRAVRVVRTLRKLLRTISSVLPKAWNVAMVLFVFFYIFGVLGVAILGELAPGKAIGVEESFANFLLALSALFRIAAEDDWPFLMFDAMDPNLPGCGDPSIGTCGSSWYALFFVLFIVMLVFVLLNLFVGVVLDSFAESQGLDASRLMLKDWTRLSELWSRVDTTGSGEVSASQAVALLCALGAPLFPITDPDDTIYAEEEDERSVKRRVHAFKAQMLRELASLDVKLTARNRVQFVWLLRGLTKRSLGLHLSEPDSPRSKMQFDSTGLHARVSKKHERDMSDFTLAHWYAVNQVILKNVTARKHVTGGTLRISPSDAAQAIKRAGKAEQRRQQMEERKKKRAAGGAQVPRRRSSDRTGRSSSRSRPRSRSKTPQQSPRRRRHNQKEEDEMFLASVAAEDKERDESAVEMLMFKRTKSDENANSLKRRTMEDTGGLTVDVDETTTATETEEEEDIVVEERRRHSTHTRKNPLKQKSMGSAASRRRKKKRSLTSSQ